jgi:hypothetical protein
MKLIYRKSSWGIERTKENLFSDAAVLVVVIYELGIGLVESQRKMRTSLR